MNTEKEQSILNDAVDLLNSVDLYFIVQRDSRIFNLLWLSKEIVEHIEKTIMGDTDATIALLQCFENNLLKVGQDLLGGEYTETSCYLLNYCQSVHGLVYLLEKQRDSTPKPTQINLFNL